MKQTDIDKVDKEYVEKDCITLLQDYTNNFITNADALFKIYRNSGKDYNDFGRFEECEITSDSIYMLATVDSRRELSNPLSIGLCMPTVCKEADLNGIKPYMIPAINEWIPFIFQGVEGLNFTSLVLDIDDIHLVNSKYHNHLATQFKWENFLFLLAMIFIVVFTIFSSVITHRYYLKRRTEA